MSKVYPDSLPISAKIGCLKQVHKMAKMGFLWRVAGLSIRGEELEQLKRNSERSQLRCFGHLIMMPPGCLSLKVFQAHTTGRRPLGRLGTRWRDVAYLLAWECLEILQEVLEGVFGLTDIYLIITCPKLIESLDQYQVWDVVTLEIIVSERKFLKLNVCSSNAQVWFTFKLYVIFHFDLFVIEPCPPIPNLTRQAFLLMLCFVCFCIYTAWSQKSHKTFHWKSICSD